MATSEPISATVIREPSPDAICSCDHPVGCDCICHDRFCDPVIDACHVDFLPDEGGYAYWGCPRCSPGQEAPHFLGCELIGWNVPMPVASPLPRGGVIGSSALA